MSDQIKQRMVEMMPLLRMMIRLKVKQSMTDDEVWTAWDSLDEGARKGIAAIYSWYKAELARYSSANTAAALKVAAEILAPICYEIGTSRPFVAVQSLITPDQSSALDAHDAQVRAEALEEAAILANERNCDNLACAIRALKKGPANG